MATINGVKSEIEWKRALFLQTGNIWYLPINYVMDCPPLLLGESDKGIYKHQKDVWVNPKSGQYQYGRNEQEVVVKAKLRPFLVFRDITAYKAIQGLNLPRHYSNVVMGFPITGLDTLEKNTSSRLDLSRLTSQNDYEFIHYISDLAQGKLPKRSFVLLNTPRTLSLNFFTTRFGCLNEADMVQIKQKLAVIFNIKK